MQYVRYRHYCGLESDFQDPSRAALWTNTVAVLWRFSVQSSQQQVLPSPCLPCSSCFHLQGLALSMFATSITYLFLSVGVCTGRKWRHITNVSFFPNTQFALVVLSLLLSKTILKNPFFSPRMLTLDSTFDINATVFLRPIAPFSSLHNVVVRSVQFSSLAFSLFI